jgi:hypothetical protein
MEASCRREPSFRLPHSSFVLLTGPTFAGPQLVAGGRRRYCRERTIYYRHNMHRLVSPRKLGRVPGYPFPSAGKPKIDGRAGRMNRAGRARNPCGRILPDMSALSPIPEQTESLDLAPTKGLHLYIAFSLFRSFRLKLIHRATPDPAWW